MDVKFNKPKGFGEILDHTFSLSKNRFKEFFMILIIFLGPVYFLEAIFQIAAGTSFFRQVGTGNNWFEKNLSSFVDTGAIDSSSLGVDISLIVVTLFSALLFPVAEAAILFAINHIRKEEEFSVGSVIKQAFSRFWPMLGSNILFGIITFAIIIIPILIVVFSFAVLASSENTIVLILLGILLFFAGAIGIGLLLTRWSFFFGSVVLDKTSPGFTRSWRLSKNRTWASMGLYIVFYIIVSIVSVAVQMVFAALLGTSVLYTMISNLASLFTTMIFSVGYAVMYLDLKTRHDADDLKDLIEDYKTN